MPATGATSNVPPLYSDIVASRPPSPRRERPAVPSTGPEEDPDATRVPHQPDVGNRMDAQFGDVNVGNSELESGNNTPAEEEAPWTTIRRRRTRSPITSRVQKPLTSEQMQAVRRAAERMTDEQRQQVQRRQEKLQARRRSSVSSRDEGPSRPKGKVIDPREWGNVNISQESLDIDAQAAALDSFGRQIDRSSRLSHRKGRSPSGSASHDRRHTRHQPMERREKRPSKRSGRPAEVQPAAQIAPKSYLGTALRGIEHARHTRRSLEPSDSSGSSSSSDSSSSDSSSTDSEAESSDEGSTTSEQK
jgi:hypothetical protein